MRERGGLDVLLERRLRELEALAPGRLRWQHQHDSRRSGGGWPDYAIAAGGLLIFAELKAERKQLTPAQLAWLRALSVGGPVLALVAVGEDGVASLVDLVIHALNGRLLSQTAVPKRLGWGKLSVAGDPDAVLPPMLAVPVASGLAVGRDRGAIPAG